MNHEDRSRLGFSVSDRVVLVGGLALVGLALGWAAPFVADAATGRDWVPFQDLTRIVAGWDAPWAHWLMVLVGGVVGVGAAAYVVGQSLRVEVGDRDLLLRHGGTQRTVGRGEVSAVFVEDKRLVLLGTDTRELLRREIEAKAPVAREAFHGHGWPWTDEDPHRDEFRDWVRGTSALPAAANAVLSARAKAVERDEDEDADDLRDELAELGFVVKDTTKRQLWRPLRS